MTHHGVVIVGAGFGGLGLAIRLRQAGIDDYVILERTNNLGGTWSRNTYPGAACDVPSSLYSYSFAPNPGWRRKYGRQQEILDYLRRTAESHGVVEHLRLRTEVLDAVFDEDSRRWRITTNNGELSADILVSAVGAFAEAAIPDIAGLSTFRGTRFHTLHWDHDHDLSGERVAVIGTGATAVQVVPEVRKVARELLVFQRTSPWIVPRLDRTISGVERMTYRALPPLQRLARGGWYAAIESFGLPGFVSTRFRHPFELLGRLQLLRQVRDPELRARLTPDYLIGCKRAIFSDDYYPALCQDNVTLVTERITEVGPHAVVTGDGAEHRVDTIILATGFTATPGLLDRVKGVDGRTIGDVYRERPQSYLGTAYSGFPNLFTVLGPFGAAGNQSAIFMIESQLTYIVDAVRRMRESGFRRVEVRPEAQQAFVEEVHERSAGGTWLGGGCTSYYTNGAGLNAGLYPNWSFEYRRRTRRFDVENYEVSR
ncbi:cation diffusion facilitator CzcD-associated flavoprotein CzcO [Saccharomonospora amisosensis]|uniref:Cation diffusion facilitator CzcD-associated flavoprotein CzcO n=1 Tax=Saccharomonospora amisosensis TaxID=1128677 RepID=A0A7X5UQW9_9PSEU|nr:NAD(P)/FAD-dependent oxidoreductase [Saccharomonospora amisosensis]NIJ12530.1 cation diffusion facilitator CzcD-associated flavoprotein CzcO [Saccharomonospora amisosensis]